MTRQQALEKLELDSEASAVQIEQSYQELHNEFQMRITNAPTEHQRKLYQTKLEELIEAFNVLTGNETNTHQDDLPALGETVQTTAPPVQEEPLSTAEAMAVLGLTAGFSKAELDAAFYQKLGECQSGIDAALNDAIAQAFIETKAQVQGAYKVLTSTPAAEPKVAIPNKPVKTTKGKEEIVAPKVDRKPSRKGKGKGKPVLIITILALLVILAVVFKPWKNMSFGGENSVAQNPPSKPYWNLILGGADKDKGVAVVHAFGGGYMVLGATELSNDDEQYWLSFINDNGEEVWRKQFPVTPLLFEGELRSTKDGNYLISGGDSDNFLLFKVDQNGELLWQTKIPGTGVTVAADLIEDNEGNILLAGIEGWNGWLAKVDANGSELWQRNYDFDPILEIHEVDNGHFILLTDEELVKINSNGEPIERIDPGLKRFESLKSVSPIMGGGFLLTGRAPATSGGLYDILAISLSAGGTVDWKKNLSGSDEAEKVIQTADGNFVIAGILKLDGHIVKIDKLGNRLWEWIGVLEGLDKLIDLVENTDGAIVAIGHSYKNDQENGDLWIQKIDKNGKSEALISDTQ